MDQKLGIRIEDPEDEHVPGGMIALAVIAMVVGLLTLYFLSIEFFDFPLEPLVKEFMGLK